MANIKQQAKRNLTNEKKRLQNASYKSMVKTTIKNVEVAIQNKNKELATKQISVAFAKLDKGLSKGIFSKNFVARRKSALSKLINTIA